MAKDLTKAEFVQKVCDLDGSGALTFKGSVPAIVDFWAEWCPPCKMLSPVMDQIETQYAGKLSVYKVNADEQPDIAAAFNILTMPTIVYLRPGQPPKSVVGAFPKSMLEKQIREYLLS